MNKTYQTEAVTGIDIAVPEAVSVSMDEIADDLREGLLALAAGAGLQVLTALMDADVAAVAGQLDPASRTSLDCRGSV